MGKQSRDLQQQKAASTPRTGEPCDEVFTEVRNQVYQAPEPNKQQTRIRTEAADKNGNHVADIASTEKCLPLIFQCIH